jgi:fructuronate reductase
MTDTRSPSRPSSPRHVHLGLGAFHKAHQVWYSQSAETDPSAPEWPIGSFTGRTPDAAEELDAQGCEYTLVERAAEGDAFHRMTQIVEARPASDTARLAELLADSAVGVVTLTITEAAYHVSPQLQLDESHPDVQADVEALTAHVAAASDSDLPALRTAAGRLVAGLAERRRADAGPLAVVPCDNLSANGDVARAAILGTARLVDAALAEWTESSVSFVSTSVDRITPRTTDDVREAATEFLGRDDAAAVVTEPFASWILSGDFPAGRPAWEKAGAQFVEEIEPFERRKLWLLNGSHSLMAYAGQLRGHATVAEAIADPVILEWVEEFWDEAAPHLASGSVTAEDLEIPAYRAALLERFRNPRIEHRLAQIAGDGTAKLALRAVPVLTAERAAGRDGRAAARALAAWAAWVQQAHASQQAQPIQDPQRDGIAAAARAAEPIPALLNLIDRDIAEDADVVDLIAALIPTLTTEN